MNDFIFAVIFLVAFGLAGESDFQMQKQIEAQQFALNR